MHHPSPPSGPRRTRRTLALAAGGALTVGALAATSTGGPASADSDWSFRHVGSFHVPDNLEASGVDAGLPTSAEIVDVTDDGDTLVYSDALSGRVGFIDISDPASPAAGGTIDLGGADPTSVAVVGDLLLVSVKTNDSFVAPTGELRVFDVDSGAPVRAIDLGGQPDSVAISPDERYAVVVIENERDEDENDGLIPQPPAGFLQVIRLTSDVDEWTPAPVALTGLADVAPDDPEPEYVDIDRKNRAVVTLQENNHMVVVDLRKARVIREFPAGSVAISGVDGTEEDLGPQGRGLIEFADDLGQRRREPDAVVWIDETRVATANEGDYEDENGDEGGSRSFTIFNVNSGNVVYEASDTFELEVARAGHYPEGRSENKGVEPEGLEVAEFGGRRLLFVGAERANVVGVYDVTNPNRVAFVQLLPTGIGPEGIQAIPDRNLLAVTSEVDGADEDFPARPVVTLFQFAPGAPAYPYLQSADEPAGTPIPWVAMSGLAGDPADADTVWAVSDSFLAQSWIYRIDVSATPAVITERIPVGGPDGAFDLEGIAARPEGGFWLASEGLGNPNRRNLVVRVDADGTVVESFGLPQGLVDIDTSSGFEGVAVTGTETGGDETVWVVVQRSWPGDPAGTVKIGRLDVETGEWTFARYQLDEAEQPAIGRWVGLSEITVLPSGNVAIVERDNQIGPAATVKRIYEVNVGLTEFVPFGGTLNTVSKTLFADVIDELDAASISVPDKLEGTAVTADGRFFMVTDNDGVDENFGETVFVELDGVLDGAGS